MPISAQRTSTVEASEPLPPSKTTDATFGTSPQVADVVLLMMWTVALAPEASVAGPNVSVPATIDHVPTGDWLSIDQLRPAITGRTSVTVTLKADPSPVLVTVTTKPI